MFLAACVQMRCTTDTDRNLESLHRHCRRAAGYGASLIATPENSLFLGPQFHKVSLAESLEGPSVAALRELAVECGAHLLIGSVAEQRLLPSGDPDSQRCYNTSLLFAPDGTMVASYRKMHLFDVDIPGGLTIAESDCIAPGEDVVVASTPLGSIGMSICL